MLTTRGQHEVNLNRLERSSGAVLSRQRYMYVTTLTLLNRENDSGIEWSGSQKNYYKNMFGVSPCGLGLRRHPRLLIVSSPTLDIPVADPQELGGFKTPSVCSGRGGECGKRSNDPEVQRGRQKYRASTWEAFVSFESTILTLITSSLSAGLKCDWRRVCTGGKFDCPDKGNNLIRSTHILHQIVLITCRPGDEG